MGSDSATYRRLYCGTCAALGEHYGTLSRTTLSYDSVLMAALVDGMQPQAAEPSSCRCPLVPIRRRPTVVPSSRAMRVAAAVQVTLTDQALADHHADGSLGAGVLRRALSGSAATAYEELAVLGFDPGRARGLARRQLQVERHPNASVRACAAPTADTLAGWLADLGDEVGAPVEARNDLAALGHALGTCIYLIDALEDLEEDVRAGEFNPCVGPDTRIYGARVDECTQLVQTATDEVRGLVERLPLLRHRGLIEHVLTVALPGRASRAIATARAAVASNPTRSRWPGIFRRLSQFLSSGWSWLAVHRPRLGRRRRALSPVGADSAGSSAECSVTPTLALASAAGPPPAAGGPAPSMPPPPVAADQGGKKKGNACDCCDCNCCDCGDCCPRGKGAEGATADCSCCEGCSCCESCDCCGCDCCGCDCSC